MTNDYGLNLVACIIRRTYGKMNYSSLTLGLNLRCCYSSLVGIIEEEYRRFGTCRSNTRCCDVFRSVHGVSAGEYATNVVAPCVSLSRNLGRLSFWYWYRIGDLPCNELL